MSTSARLFWALINFLTALAVMLLSVSLLGRLWWPFDVLTHFWPHYFVVLFLCGMLYLVRGRYYPSILCLLLAAYCTLWLWPYYLTPIQPAAGEPDLTLLVSNVYQHADTIGNLQTLVTERNPDVILLMEMVPTDQYNQVQALADTHPYFAHEPRLSGNAVFSRVPVESLDVHHWDGGRIDIKLTLSIDNQPLTIFATHARAAKSDWEARDRDLQLAHMGRYFAEQDQYAVIAGDLNVTPWSSHYRNFIQQTNLVDHRLGRGAMPTWPILPPPLNLFMIPFDHVLTTPDIAVHTYELTADIGSDHRPLWVSLSIR